MAWRTFFHDEGTGGGNGPGGRINVDSGILNLDLLTKDYGADAANLWARSKLSDRTDAIIIHEMTEAEPGSHAEALKLAPRTKKPINDRTRKILQAMELSWRGP